MNKTNDLAYELVNGKGRPVVFIHGWLGSSKSWDRVKPYLDLENPLVFYDQRCHGKSSCSSFLIEDLAEDLHNLIEELELEDPILVGHSMGGMTALRYSIDYQNFSGLCLLGTSANTPEPKVQSVEYFLKEFDRIDRLEWAEKITQNYLGDSGKKELKKMCRDELMAADPEPVKYGLKAMIEYDISDKLQRTDVPCIVVAGTEDGAITRHKSEDLAELLDSDLISIESGHLMLQEVPENIGNIVTEFVENF